MNALENRNTAIEAQETIIRRELDLTASNKGLSHYKFPGIIFDEVAAKLVADGYDVERWFFSDPREDCFSIIFFDNLATGTLYDYTEDDCSSCNSCCGRCRGCSCDDDGCCDCCDCCDDNDDCIDDNDDCCGHDCCGHDCGGNGCGGNGCGGNSCGGNDSKE